MAARSDRYELLWGLFNRDDFPLGLLRSTFAENRFGGNQIQNFLAILGVLLAAIDLFGLTERLERALLHFSKSSEDFSFTKISNNIIELLSNKLKSQKLVTIIVFLSFLLFFIFLLLIEIITGFGVFRSFGYGIFDARGYASIFLGFIFAYFCIAGIILAGSILDVIIAAGPALLEILLLSLAKILNILAKPKKGIVASIGFLLMVLGIVL